ncbi:MAG: aldo/keto reductase [Bryobacterales bacterium]|nr:aldo/keto reductase [Bryobacterales bacterium]
MRESTTEFGRTLGRTGLQVGPLGIASSYGVSAAGVEYAFEHGINYLYWGSFRSKGFGQGIRNCKQHRERMALVLQSYSRFAFLLEHSVDRGLRALGLDYADVLLLGWWNRPVTERLLDRARELVAKGKVRHLAISSHACPEFARFAANPETGILHIRYNAAHRGAERDTFPHLGEKRPGTVVYTATSWGQLMKSKRIPRDVPRPTAGDCYRFVLSKPTVDLCMTGPASLAHVQEAVKAMHKGPMDPDELDWMRRVGDAVYGKPRV